MNKEGSVVAVCTSKRTGMPKRPVDEAILRVNWGIEGDAHAGDWHRQVSLLAMESIAKMQAKGLKVKPGSFAENITTEGLVLWICRWARRCAWAPHWPRSHRSAKICHDHCAIYELAGDCVMPREDFRPHPGPGRFGPVAR